VASFVHENKVENKGVQFGRRLKSWKEIEQACGYPETPAPGGNTRIPSFVHDSKVQSKGVQFGHKLKTRREIEEACGWVSFR